MHCPGCWETPCLCDDAKGYAHLSVVELEALHAAIGRLLDARRAEGGDRTLRHFDDGGRR